MQSVPRKIKGTKEGIWKQIHKAGQGGTPPPGARCTVHYVGKIGQKPLGEDTAAQEALVGHVFDSSRARKEPLKFTLGKGFVLKAWDAGISTMQKGEVATISARSDFCYGKAGSYDQFIPSNCTLDFEVELLDWEVVKKEAAGAGVVNVRFMMDVNQELNHQISVTAQDTLSSIKLKIDALLPTVAEQLGEKITDKGTKIRMFRKFFTTLPLESPVADPRINVGTGRRIVLVAWLSHEQGGAYISVYNRVDTEEAPDYMDVQLLGAFGSTAKNAKIGFERGGRRFI